MGVDGMSIVKARNKKSGITYVYESESYWDKEKKQPRNKRKLIGKIDAQTGDIVPTRGRGRIECPAVPAQSPQADAGLRDLCRTYEKQAASQEELIRTQASEISRLKAERKEAARRLAELAKGLGAQIQPN
jgi:hypothetical protein